MGRLQLFEIHDSDRCPRRWRDCMTELMRWSIDRLRVYDPVLPKLRLLLAKAGTDQIVDLCSGGAGPWRRLGGVLEADLGRPVRILLTDKFPNIPAFERVGGLPIEAAGHIDFIADSVDATQVPPALTGVRTLFSSFHHFAPAVARSILSDAAQQGAPIGVFEYTERSVFACVGMAFAPLVSLVVVPFLRPFSGWRLLSCLPIPFVPFIATWDGFVSNLRTYSPQELMGLVAGLDVKYRWETGRLPGRFGLSVTYLIGVPEGS